MKRFKDFHIRTKLKFVILSTSIITLVLIFIGFFAYEEMSFKNIMLNTIGSTADLIARNSNAAVAFGERKGAAQILRSLSSQSHVEAAAIYNSRGSLLATYSRAGTTPVFPKTPSLAKAGFSKNALTVLRPINLDRQRIGTLYIRMDLGQGRKRFAFFLEIALCVLIISLAVAYFLSNVLARNISAPIVDLATTFRQISVDKDYTVRARSDSRDETGVLADTFNEMLTQIEMRDRELLDYRGQLETLVEKRTAQLESANKELEAFSYSVSHDLRAPLRHIDGFSDLLTRHAGSMLDDKGKRYLRMISDSVKEMGTLIDDLLSFSRMSRAQMKESQVDVGKIVNEVIDSLAPECEGRNIEWDISALPSIRADPSLLRMVFQNLLGNAIKYTRPRENAVIRVSSEKKGSDVIFCVKDNGVGFDMQYAGKLFGVFQRLHRADEFEGTGIGLANVRRIIQRHQGTTWAEGEVDKGASFFFSLPDETKG